MYSRSKWLLDRRHLIDAPSFRSNIKVGQYGTIFLKIYNSIPLDFYPTVLIEKYTVRSGDFNNWRSSYNNWYRDGQYVFRNFRHWTGELSEQLGADGDLVVRVRYIYASMEKVFAYSRFAERPFSILYDPSPYQMPLDEPMRYLEKQIVNWKTEGF